MITKIRMIEKCEMRIAGGAMTADLRSRYPRALVRSVMGEGYDSLLGAMFNATKDYSVFDSYTKTFTPTTNPPVVVQYDSEREEYYSELPKNIVILENNEGIRLIAPLKAQGAAFAPMAVSSVPIFDELDVNKISPDAEYYQEERNVYYRFPVTVYTDLIMKLIPTFSELDDQDEVDEPAIMSKNGLYTIYDYAYERLVGMPITKQTENNNPTT